MKPCAVLIPVYKKKTDADETACIDRYFKILSQYDLIFFVPESLDLSWYEKRYPSAKFERFADRYFTGTKGYNRLLLSDAFYARFASYDYILIAQPDAVIWQSEDRIREYIERGFDYIGAPWIPERRIWEWLFPKQERFPFFRIRCCKKKGQGITMGNGGFCLRRVSACRKLIRQYRWRKCYWFLKRSEDIFFGLTGSDNRNDFRLADVKTGKGFSREFGLRKCVETGDIPYAVHGWSKEYASYEEMREHLASFGITI